MFEHPVAIATANSAMIIDGSISALASSSLTPPTPGYDPELSIEDSAKKNRGNASMYTTPMKSPSAGIGQNRVTIGIPMASSKTVAR